jgi:hypothetical protein
MLLWLHGQKRQKNKIEIIMCAEQFCCVTTLETHLYTLHVGHACLRWMKHVHQNSRGMQLDGWTSCEREGGGSSLSVRIAMGWIWVGWTKNSTREKIESDEKLHLHQRVKFQTRVRTHGFRVPVGFVNGLAQSSLDCKNELTELDQMHHSSNNFQSQV